MGEFRELSESECRARLVECSTGRVAVSTPEGPHIIPVNYAVVSESVVIRTSRTTVLGTFAPGAWIAFEVERTGDVTRSGWSVVARGPVTAVLDEAELAQIRRVWDPDPWADGDRTLYLRLAVCVLTGRAVGDRWAELAGGDLGAFA